MVVRYQLLSSLPGTIGLRLPRLRLRLRTSEVERDENHEIDVTQQPPSLHQSSPPPAAARATVLTRSGCDGRHCAHTKRLEGRQVDDDIGDIGVHDIGGLLPSAIDPR